MANSELHKYRTLSTENNHAYSIKFNPIYEDLIAVAGAENFGIKGKGSLLLYNLSARNPLVGRYPCLDAVFDVSWNKTCPNIIISASGDGLIQIWDITGKIVSSKMIPAHTQEVSSVTSCFHQPDVFASSSWDASVKLWNINSLQPVNIMMGHQLLVYQTVWSNLNPGYLASVSGDGTTIIWDPMKIPYPILRLPCCNVEVLSCDWSNCDTNLLVTASADAIIRGWDIRSPSAPVFSLGGHENAIRKIKFSHFISNEFTTVSYDFTTRLWNISVPSVSMSAVKSHTEFVYGLDYSWRTPGVVADCSWDQTLQLYKIGAKEEAVYYEEAAASSEPHTAV